MTKQFLSGFERDNTYDCLQCNQPITNPLCHSCLGQGIADWLKFYPDIKKKIMPKLKSYIAQVNNEALGSLNCASCNSKKAALCPYCFTEGVLNLLKKTKVDKLVIGDFLSVFNFDMKHEGYIGEAIREGLF